MRAERISIRLGVKEMLMFSSMKKINTKRVTEFI